MPLRAAALFAFLFAVSVVVQGYFWTHFEYTDKGLWLEATQSFSEGDFFARSRAVTALTGYPATALLFSAAALTAAGVPTDTAFVLVVVFMLSLITAAAGTLAYILRPQSLAWAGIALPLMVHHLHPESTVPTSLCLPLSTLFLLVLMGILERSESKRLPIVLGITGGIILCTRYDIGLALMGSAGILCVVLGRIRMFLRSALYGAAMLIIGNPYLLMNPVWQIRNTLGLAHEVTSFPRSPIPFEKLFSFSPPAFLSFAFATVLAFYRRGAGLSVPRALVLWLLGTTAVVMLFLLFSAKTQAYWYFFPFFVMAESLLALLLLPELEKRGAPGRLLSLGVVVALTLLQAFQVPAFATLL